MNKLGKIAIVVVLAAAVVMAIAVKRNKSGQDTTTGHDGSGQQVSAEYGPEELIGKGLPALVDLGAGTCIPCKMMAPILQELKTSFVSKLQVEFLDVHENPDLISKYSVRVIPTQIFYGPSGKELFRHEGFMSKEDILAKWAELGVQLTKAK